MDFDKIARRISMSRGILVLDENLEALAEPLRKLNINVIQVQKGMLDPDIRRAYLSRRIFVTDNLKDFDDYATSFEYGIISLKNFKFKDSDKAASNKAAQFISKAIIKHSLWSKGYNFLVTINKDGSSTFRELTD